MSDYYDVLREVRLAILKKIIFNSVVVYEGGYVGLAARDFTPTYENGEAPIPTILGTDRRLVTPMMYEAIEAGDLIEHDRKNALCPMIVSCPHTPEYISAVRDWWVRVCDIPEVCGTRKLPLPLRMYRKQCFQDLREVVG